MNHNVTDTLDSTDHSTNSGDSSSGQTPGESSSNRTSPEGSSSGSTPSHHSPGTFSGDHPATGDESSDASGPTNRNGHSSSPIPESSLGREALLSSIIENTSDAIISKNLEGIINSWNRGAEAMFGYTAEEAVGQPITMLIPKERLSEEDQILKRLRNGEKLEEFETVRQRKDGKRIYVSLTISPVLDEDGNIVGASKIVRDITRRKKAEEKLKDINATLEERVEERTQALIDYQEQLRSLASRLSEAEEQERQRLAGELHDNLGQMLAVTKMKVDMLSQQQISGEVDKAIADIRQGLKEALNYTRDLMSDLKPPPTLDKENVTESIEWLAEKMQKHGLKVMVEDDGKPKETRREIRTALLQSVRELLFNVIKHTDEEEALVRLKTTGGHVQIWVEDDGPGINEDASDAPSEEGGFGLFNIKERLDLLGCQLDIEAKPGGGTSIRLVAPLKNTGNGSAPSYATPKRSGRSEQRRPAKVMLVDDQRMVRRGLKEVLDREKDIAVVAEASGGAEALEQVEEVAPDVILMDLVMPDMDGVEATRRLKERVPEVSIIGLSIHKDDEMVERLYEAGATAFLSKQEAFETLCETIRGETRHLKE